MTARYILTVDLGTSGPKAAVVSSDGRIVGSGQRKVVTHFPAPGAAEQDPDEIWAATVGACREALAESGHQGVTPPEVIAVIVSSQYSSIIPVDQHGRHLHPMMTWMDHRGHPKKLQQLPNYPKRSDSPRSLYRFLRMHGVPPIDGGIALNHMRYLAYSQPNLYARTVAFLEPTDYLTMRLCGRPVANQCSAFMSCCIDNRQLGSTRYHPNLIGASLIEPSKFPPLVPVGETLGPVVPAVADELGLHHDTVVLSGCNDTQAGAIAAGAFRGNHVGISLGTTGVIVTHRDKRKTDPRTSIFTMPSAMGDCHLVSAENGVAGVGVDHFLRTVVYGDDPFRTNESTVDAYDAFNEAAALSRPGARGVTYLPWLRGSIAPKADGRMRGGFINIGVDTDRNDMARALYEGVALNFQWLHTKVEQFVGRTSTHAVFYGGGATSPLWSQIMADVLDRPIHRLADPRHANSLGTGLLGFERLLVIDPDEVLRLPQIAAVFEPNPAHRAMYDERGERFREAFAANRSIMRELNRTRSADTTSTPSEDH